MKVVECTGRDVGKQKKNLDAAALHTRTLIIQTAIRFAEGQLQKDADSARAEQAWAPACGYFGTCCFDPSQLHGMPTHNYISEPLVERRGDVMFQKDSARDMGKKPAKTWFVVGILELDGFACP